MIPWPWSTTFPQITNWAASSAPSSAPPSLHRHLNGIPFGPFELLLLLLLRGVLVRVLWVLLLPRIQSNQLPLLRTQQILRLLIQISPFLTAWHLQTAASFKLFSFDGSGGSSDASAKLSPAAAFAIECSMRGRGKDCTDFSISSALEEIRS